MAKKSKKLPRYYWDSCVFLSLIEGTLDRIDSIIEMLDSASKGNLEIWTSVFTIGEVAFAKQEKDKKALDPSVQTAIDNLWKTSFIKLVEVHRGIMTEAQQMVRVSMNNGLRLTAPDAVHIATAKANGITTIHTYDTFNGKAEELKSLFGVELCVPPKPNPSLFDEPEKEPEESVALATDAGESPVCSDEHTAPGEETVTEEVAAQETEEAPLVDDETSPAIEAGRPVTEVLPVALPAAPVAIAASSEESATSAATPPIVVTVISAPAPAVEMPKPDDSVDDVASVSVDGEGSMVRPTPVPIAVAAETRPANTSLPDKMPPDEVAGDSSPPESELA